MPFTFEQVFLAALGFYFLVHVITCSAEIVHLKRTIGEVPAELTQKITLPQHVKAARYDIARTKLNLLEVTVTTLIIFALTRLNGINELSEILMDAVGDQFAFHWMLPASIALLFILVDLPFSWYKEFRLREAYGYTRENRGTWMNHFVTTSLLGWLAILPVLWIGLWFWHESGAAWWILGWLIFSAYLIFPLNLARRLRYFIKPELAREIHDEALIDRFNALGDFNNITISTLYVARPEDNDELPPAFAFGHKKGVRLFFRHDVFERLNNKNLIAIGAHALGRNKSHMYFQAWFVCSMVALLVFIFLAWFAPQSWFLDEIGFRAIGPGPYYGSLLAFAMVALPVLLFPFKLPMDAFLRHLIYRSDSFALRYTSLETISSALIDLTPSPMRHSCMTLEFFDLLFSHEPSLMARLHHVQKHYQKLRERIVKSDEEYYRMQLLHSVENVTTALETHESERRLAQAIAADEKLHQEAHKAELALIEKGRSETTPPAILAPFTEAASEEAQASLAADNSQHRTHGMSLTAGFLDIVSRLKAAWKAARAKRKEKSAPSVVSATTDKDSESEELLSQNEATTEAVDEKMPSPIMPEMVSESMTETNDATRNESQDDSPEMKEESVDAQSAEMAEQDDHASDQALETETIDREAAKEEMAPQGKHETTSLSETADEEAIDEKGPITLTEAPTPESTAEDASQELNPKEPEAVPENTDASNTSMQEVAQKSEQVDGPEDQVASTQKNKAQRHHGKPGSKRRPMAVKTMNRRQALLFKKAN